VLPIAVGQPGDRSHEFVVAESAESRVLWFFAPDRELKYPEPEFEAELKGGELTVRAKVLLRDVVVAVDRVDAEATIDQNLVTILPGEVFTFRTQSKRELSKEELVRRPVLQCANWFGRRD
jgi:beta-mannosidase